MDPGDKSDQITAACSHSEDSATRRSRSNIMSSDSRWISSSTEDMDLVVTEDGLRNGTYDVETMVALHCPGDSGDVAAQGDPLALSNDGMSEFSNSDLSLPEVCISTNSNSFEENMNYEVQQAYRIFTGFLLDKHKGIASPFLQPMGHHDAQHGIGGVCGQGQAQLKQSMCLRRMEEKFICQEYETITEFVADFRLMLENCYRYHGVDHWISKQAQKLEIMLEQKLTLLSRTLREQTTLAVTSKGRFGAEEERGSGGYSTRRRLAPRSLATITVGGHESIMVQALRLEEQQRAKEEKRQRELEKKEAEETSAKEVEEWEQSLMLQSSPQTVDTLWELPAIGHFLCLAQTALNLPEIVFFELERCLLMPRCSILLSKIMSSLLSPWQKRATLHRRPALPYRRWESELRHRTLGWYRAVGSAHDQPAHAEQLGLCQQFFRYLGELSPLEEQPFHLLPFYQRVWLLKGLCDHVYETQKDVQDAVLAQPIHECRESILGYDSKENAYIHFPHFCGADLRIYCQSPSTPPTLPFPSVLVKRVEVEPLTDGEESDGMKYDGNKSDIVCHGGFMDTGESDDFGKQEAETFGFLKRENGDGEENEERFKLWSIQKEEGSESVSSDGDSCEDSKLNLNIHTNALSFSHTSAIRGSSVKTNIKEETVALGHPSKRHERGFPAGSLRTIKAETQEPCLSVGEHSYTGRSPARSVNVASPTKSLGIKMEEASSSQGHLRSSCLECCKSKTSHTKSVLHGCDCGTSQLATQSSDSTQNSGDERITDQIQAKTKKRKRKRGKEQLPGKKGENTQLQYVDRMSLYPAEEAKSALQRVTTTIKRKDRKKKHKAGKKMESSKKIKDEPPVEPSFKLVCTSLEELRELISKTEDELDDLESTKKRLGRWYYRREAVKDLHSTLIRLLNELSPWEPKLVKAYQRNRLRLKREFDDFKKHPEYSNFVREECVSSSSSSEDEESGLGKELCSLDHNKRSEEDDLEHMVPRGLWSGASTREFLASSPGERTGTYVSPNHLKHPLASPEKGINLLPRVQIGGSNITSTPDSGPQTRTHHIPSNQFRYSNSALAARMPAQTSPCPRPPILHPTTGLPKGYTPIPTLLAKSVGNKVTLMKRPDDCSGLNNRDRKSKESSICLAASAGAITKSSKAQICPSSSLQNSQQLQVKGQQRTQVPIQPAMATVIDALPKSPPAKPTQTVLKNPVQVVYKVPEGLGQLVRKDNKSPVKISVHPIVDQNTGEKIMQQVVILPSNLLIHNSEEKVSSSHPQQSTVLQVPVSKVASPLCMSTNVPGFTIPENRIPVQQVAPLKDVRVVKTPSPSFSPCLQHGALNTAGFKGAQVFSSQGNTPQGIKPNASSIITSTSAASTVPVKSTDPKQELKTVCIRDSQSILVTTRGGNTGIVKVQASSDQNELGCLSNNPVITISPQFKAFLVSKTSQTSSVPTQTSPCTIPALTGISVAQPQKQLTSLLKNPSTVTNPIVTALPGSIALTGPEIRNTGTTVALNQGSNISAGSTVATKIGQLVQTAAAGSDFQASIIKSTFVVPSVSSSSVSQVLTQAESFGKTGLKRANTDERSHVTKFLLVSPPSSSASNVAASDDTSSCTKSLPSSTVMIINQPTETSSATFVGSVPKQAIATGANGKLLTTLLSSRTMKMGLGLGQTVGSVNSEALSKSKNITLPTGVQIQLSGKTTTIGQTIGALSLSPSNGPSVSLSDTGHSPATTTRLLPFLSSNTVTSCPTQLASHGMLTSSSQLQGIPSFKHINQPSSSTSTATTVTAANMTKKDLSLPKTVLSCNSAAQVTTTIHSSPAHTSTTTLVCQPPNFQSSFSEETTSILSSSQLALGKNQKLSSSATTNSAPFATSATGTIQQRIVINTSTPLAAGTQIFLNNARFVVPPQGLGPGNHVLIIASPAPLKMPSVSATSIGSVVPPQGDVAVASRAPQSPARVPGVPAINSAFVACTSAAGPSLIATTPSRAASALPRLQTSLTSNFASPPIRTTPRVSCPPRLGSVPAQFSPLITSSPGLGSALATITLPASTPTQAECSSTNLTAIPPPLSRFTSPFPVLPSPPAIVLPNPVIPSAPYLYSLPDLQDVSVTTLDSGIQQQHIDGPSATSTVPSLSLTHMGLSNTSVKNQVPAIMQPVIAGPRTQVLPTVAVPPIVSTVSRVQKLPIAMVPPIGSTTNAFETAPVGTTPPSSSTVLITLAQPITSLKTNNTIHQPIVQKNQALGKHSLQTSAVGVHTSAATKLLISPDGAVLSTGLCQVNSACPKPLAALMVSPNSSTGALHTHDSYFPPSQANTKDPIN